MRIKETKWDCNRTNKIQRETTGEKIKWCINDAFLLCCLLFSSCPLLSFHLIISFGLKFVSSCLLFSCQSSSNLVSSHIILPRLVSPLLFCSFSYCLFFLNHHLISFFFSFTLLHCFFFITEVVEYYVSRFGEKRWDKEHSNLQRQGGEKETTE